MVWACALLKRALHRRVPAVMERQRRLGVRRGVQAGADEVVLDGWARPSSDALDAMSVARIRYLVGHPSTRFPAVEIEAESRAASSGHAFAMCYADLDPFKDYDRYSYYDGDRVIRIRRDSTMW